MFDADVCWQYQVKQSKRLELSIEALDVFVPMAEVRVEAVNYRVAKQFIEQYEWLGNLGSAQVFFALLWGDEILSVVCFARPASRSSLKKQLGIIADLSVFQLCRGATSPIAPSWAASHLISKALKLLAKARRVCVVVAYADPRAGEIGVVYQSANALYLGVMDSRGPGQYVIRGRAYHPRTVHRVFGSARHESLKKVDPNYVRIQRTKKHRYLFVTAKGARRKLIIRALEPHLRPAPKRSKNSS